MLLQQRKYCDKNLTKGIMEAIMGITKHAGYFFVDLHRALVSKKFVAGILGICLILLYGCREENFESASVLYLFWWSFYGIQYIFTMILCALPYSGSFCEDMEYGYIRQMLIRGKLSRYCISKTIVIGISSVLTMLSGGLLFVGILRIYMPWTDVEGSVYLSAVKNGSFHELLGNNHYFAYFSMFAIQSGLLMVILSLFSAWLSLYIKNRLLTLAVPIIFYYFASQITNDMFKGAEYMNLNFIFGGTHRIFDSDIKSFLYAVIYTCVVSVVITYGIYKKLKSEMQNE